MALDFRQQPLPPGVFHVLVDDGSDVTHIFNECARWSDVARAAGQGSSFYADRCWVRAIAPDSAVEAATEVQPHLLRRLAGLLPGVRSGQSSS